MQEEPRFTRRLANSALRFWQHLGKRVEMNLICSLMGDVSLLWAELINKNNSNNNSFH